MKRIIALSLIVLLLIGCLPVDNAVDATSTSTPRAILTLTPLDDVQVIQKTERPNILFILADDLDVELGTLEYMPHLQELLVAQGLTINDFFISQPLCCPSRATLLRGQYTHNHGVYRNDFPYGGFDQFYFLKNESSTVGTWLQPAGYKTALLGKYLNEYPFPEDRLYVPIGWDEWYVGAKGRPYGGFNYSLNENGILVDYSETGQGPSHYVTDVLASKAMDFMRRSSASGDPFFVYLGMYAPHVPAKPAPRHADLYPDLRAPRTPSFNEEDVSDKPSRTRNDPLLTDDQIAKLDQEYRNRVRSMQAVDEAIADMVSMLAETGQLDNTYIIFTSDNGYHLGQHRMLGGKGEPYDTDIHVPFIIRGPGIEAGSVLDGYIVGNVDFAPTIAELAGVIPPAYVDGRSFVSLFGSSKPDPADWRSALLLEFYGYNNKNEPALSAPPEPEYLGLRTRDYLYVKYADGFIELYDLNLDPDQLENIAATADRVLLEQFSDWLNRYSACLAEQCRRMDQEK